MLGVVKQQQQTEIKIWHIWAHKVLNASISMGGRYIGIQATNNLTTMINSLSVPHLGT